MLAERLVALEARVDAVEHLSNQNLSRWETFDRWQRDNRNEAWGFLSRVKSRGQLQGSDPSSVPGAGLAQPPSRSDNPFAMPSHRGLGTLASAQAKTRPVETKETGTGGNPMFDFDAIEHVETQTGKSLQLPAQAPAAGPTSVVLEADPMPTARGTIISETVHAPLHVEPPPGVEPRHGSEEHDRDPLLQRLRENTRRRRQDPP